MSSRRQKKAECLKETSEGLFKTIFFFLFSEDEATNHQVQTNQVLLSLSSFFLFDRPTFPHPLLQASLSAQLLQHGKQVQHRRGQAATPLTAAAWQLRPFFVPKAAPAITNFQMFGNFR
jgi:hypothetical protein